MKIPIYSEFREWKEKNSELNAQFIEYWKTGAGRLSFSIGLHGFHFLPSKDYQSYELSKSWHDGPTYEIGLGPFFKYAYAPWTDTLSSKTLNKIVKIYNKIRDKENV